MGSLLMTDCYTIGAVSDDGFLDTGLQKGFEKCGHEFITLGECELLKRLEEGVVDCLLLDERLDHRCGIELLRSLRQQGITVPGVLVVTAAAPQTVMQAIESGFSYVVQRPVQVVELVARVEQYAAQFRKQAVDKIRIEHERTVMDKMSDREIQVLRLLASGMLNKQIAVELGVGLRTVETYRNRVMTKISANSFADAVAFAISVGLREPGVRQKVI